MQRIDKMIGCDSILIRNKRATESYIVSDLPEFVELAKRASINCDCRAYPESRNGWRGGLNYDQALNAAEHGYIPGVERSSKLLDQLDQLVPVSRSFVTRDDVVGSFPNIPAMLSGNPCHMRRRIRTLSQFAPLAIIADTSSSSNINANQSAQRGVAILALVRLLTNIRPVDLYAYVSIGDVDRRCQALIKIETSPLDLARSAYVLSHPAFYRALGYATLSTEFMNASWGGGWSFGSPDLHRSTAMDSIRRVIPLGSDCLYIPAISIQDKSIDDPKTWLTEKLQEYGGVQMAA